MQEHELWLDYAANDLKTAKISFNEDAILSSAFFLTQQCAEKALKGFLIYKKKPIRRTHDLVQILKECIKIEPAFSKIKDEVYSLNPFSITFRYPDLALPFPDKTTLGVCIKEAENILNLVNSFIS